MNKKLEKNVSYYFDTMWPIKVVDKSFISVIICVTGVIISFNFAYLGFYCGVVVLACYLAGIYFWKHIISSWLELLLKYLNSNYIPTNHLKKNADNQKCEVQVPDSIDQALEQIFYRFLNQYISNWYCHISSDASFQLEVRAGIQHVVTAVCNRLTKVEIDRFLLCRAIPVFLHHAGKTSYETSRVHIALHSRKSEILYLQNLSKILLKYLLPHSSVNCRLYTTLLREITSKSLLLSFSDTVCNPGVLNHLVLRCFDRKFGTNCSLMLETSEIIHVPLLQNFLNDRQINSCYWTLRPTINDILKDEELRNTFMQYLKGCGTEYILQFCLDVDSFNEKMLKPELNTEELDNLYKDAWDLFSVYFSNYSPNCIRFHKDLASPLRKALSKDILKLRTTATLFEAYEYAFSLLEEYCQDFYNSAEFYRWLYGQHDDNDSITLNKLHCNTFIEIKTQKLVKMKGVSKRNNHLHERAQNLCADTTDSETQSKEMGVNYQSNLVPEIDINKWKITISEVNSRVNPFTGKTFSVLSIRVFGENNADWLIQRTLDDLHSLHSKLLEIDERTDKIQFPSFKSLTVHTEHIPAYEDYLNEAIKLSNFQNSYLLYNFLTSSEYINDEQVDGDNVTDDDDEDEFNEEAEGEEGLDKIFHKFSARPPIFKKEQSQNLETFVNSVILSCIPRNYAHDDIEENKSVNKMHLKVNSCDLYENNSNIEENSTVKMICDTEETELSNKCFLTPFTLVIYVAFKIYCIREYVIKFVLTWKSVFGNIVDQFILNVTNIYLNIFMKNSSPSYLINTIEWAVFDNDIKFNEEETKKKITRLLLDAKNDWLYPVYNVIFKNLQDSKRNKELFYNLADIIMEELFPEILTPSAESVK